MAELTPPDEVEETYHEIADLATMLASSQAGVRPSELTCKQRNRIYISLVQVHADALNQTGVATYYDRVKKLGPSEALFAVAKIIEAVEEASDPGGHLIARETKAEPGMESE